MGGIDYETINAQALAAYPELLKRWFPAGRVAGREFMAGNLQGAPGDSLKINIDTGIGADFATDETFGDPISLNALRLKCRASEAALDLAETLGTGLAGEMHGHGHQSNGRNNDTIVPIVPVPREASQMHYHHREHGAPSQCWPYHDAEGRLMGYVCRWDTQSSDGTLDKEIRPVTWCDLGNGKRGWRAKGIPAPRPLLNLPGILASPDTPVLVCEGEKAAEAAAKRFPDTVATTPMHGAQSPHMTDWSVLEGREVTVWPDADEAGAGFADTVARLAREAGAASVRIVQVPEGLPQGWDLADKAPDGMDLVALLAEAPERDANAGALGGDDKYEQAVIRLAALPPHKYDRVRMEEKKRLGVRVETLDSDVKAARASASGDNALQGRALQWHEPEPWPEPVDGAAMLAEIAALIARYVSMPAPLTEAVALWVVMTRLHDRLDVSPFLNLTSATKRCGKSLLLELIAEFVHRPLPTGNLTPAVLFRVIEKSAPTLLLDEADRTFAKKDIPDLIAVINSSQRRSGAYVLRCVGEDHEPRNFSSWCPKVMAGIDDLPDTVLDRALVVRMQRKPPGQSLPLWRDRDCDAIKRLQRQIVKWTGDNAKAILAQRNNVTFPAGLHDRARDAWEALLAIADVAGGQWAGDTGRAWRACEYVNVDAGDQETAAAETLLVDLYQVFNDVGDPDAMGTSSILEALHAMQHRPWSEWRRGKPLSPRGLADLLRPFKVRPATVRLPGGSTPKGYRREALQALWDTYLPREGAVVSATPPQLNEINNLQQFSSAT